MSFVLFPSQHFSLPPSILRFFLSSPREPRIKIWPVLVKGKHSSHPGRGCDQLFLAAVLNCSGNCSFFAGNRSFFGICFASQFMGVQVLTHRSRFSLHCSVSHLPHDIRRMITEVVVNNQRTNLGVRQESGVSRADCLSLNNDFIL